jgi:hypothetical protein
MLDGVGNADIRIPYGGADHAPPYKQLVNQLDGFESNYAYFFLYDKEINPGPTLCDSSADYSGIS